MSDAQREAIKRGREESRAVDEYLRYLEQNKPRRGRQRNPDRVRLMLEQVVADLQTATGIHRIELIQKKKNLQSELWRLEHQVDSKALENAFVANAAAYSERKGIGYETWREAGVPADVLKRAGLHPGAARQSDTRRRRSREA